MATDAMNAWVGRVLGVSVDAAPAAQPSSGAVSIMKLGKARVEWIGIRAQAAADLARLTEAISAEFADDAEQAPQLAAAVKQLRERIDRLDPTLEEQLDQVLQAPDAARPPLVQAARKTLGDFTRFIATDPIMTKLDGNEVLPDMMVVASLRMALINIAAALG